MIHSLNVLTSFHIFGQIHNQDLNRAAMVETESNKVWEGTLTIQEPTQRN